MELDAAGGTHPADADVIRFEPDEFAATVRDLARSAHAAREVAARLETMPSAEGLRDPGNPDAPGVVGIVHRFVDAAAGETRAWAETLTECAEAVSSAGRDIEAADAESAHAFRAAGGEVLER